MIPGAVLLIVLVAAFLVAMIALAATMAFLLRENRRISRGLEEGDGRLSDIETWMAGRSSTERARRKTPPSGTDA